VRKRVPAALREALGKREIWRSLRTDSITVAKRRAFHAIGQIEADLDQMSKTAGRGGNPTLSEPRDNGRPWTMRSILNAAPTDMQAMAERMPPSVLTFGEAYDRFLCDPTQDWSPRTRLAYQTTRRLALSIIGANRPLEQVDRAACRDFLDTLRYLPKGASRAFPKLTAKEAAAEARASGYANLISPSNINTYLNKLCVMLNWAVTEDMLSKNHLKGLRMADPVNQRDKRLPFDDAQLEAIFSAPLYTGCLNDEGGYSIKGPNRPKGTRYWVPLIGLFSGMRLNEICQLDTSDVRIVDDVNCFVATTESLCGTTDKRLKTASSMRLVPVHPRLLSLGFESFVVDARRAGRIKLFEDINPGSLGIRSTAFSKWFIQFINKVSASRPRTSYHSFRHCFRDALREARVDRELAMALGGWGNGGKTGLDVSDLYGRGFSPRRLRDEIAKVQYSRVNAIDAL
jgi:integrase